MEARVARTEARCSRRSVRARRAKQRAVQTPLSGRSHDVEVASTDTAGPVATRRRLAARPTCRGADRAEWCCLTTAREARGAPVIAAVGFGARRAADASSMECDATSARGTAAATEASTTATASIKRRLRPGRRGSRPDRSMPRPSGPVPTLRSHVPWRDDQAGIMEIVERPERQADVHGAARAVDVQQAVGRESSIGSGSLSGRRPSPPP